MTRAGSGRWATKGGTRAAGLLAVFLALAAVPDPVWSQWTQPPGRAWSQLTLYHIDTREEYSETGEVRDFFAEGHDVTTSLFLTTAVGIVRGLDVWLQVPFHHLSFDDAARERERTGLGDVRTYVRVSPEVLGAGHLPLAVALRGGVKFPATQFPVDAEVIPLTEGQTDWELFLELGKSLYPAPVYLAAWLGYRIRTRNDRIRFQPGDEKLLYVAVGGHFGHLTWKTAFNGLWGVSPTIEGIEISSASRRLLELVPEVGWDLGPFIPTVGVKLDVDGRNFPRGPTLKAGVFVPWTVPWTGSTDR